MRSAPSRDSDVVIVSMRRSFGAFGLWRSFLGPGAVQKRLRMSSRPQGTRLIRPGPSGFIFPLHLSAVDQARPIIIDCVSQVPLSASSGPAHLGWRTAPPSCKAGHAHAHMWLGGTGRIAPYFFDVPTTGDWGQLANFPLASPATSH